MSKKIHTEDKADPHQQAVNLTKERLLTARREMEMAIRTDQWMAVKKAAETIADEAWMLTTLVMKAHKNEND